MADEEAPKWDRQDHVAEPVKSLFNGYALHCMRSANTPG